MSGSSHLGRPEPYHGAGEVVLGQTQVHHTLGAVELRLPRGRLGRVLWSERGAGVKGDREKKFSPPFPQGHARQLGGVRTHGRCRGEPGPAWAFAICGGACGEKEVAIVVPGSGAKPAASATGTGKGAGRGMRGHTAHTPRPRHPPSEAMSGASSEARCSCCLGPSCLLKGLRWACRNRASLSSYSIASHLPAGQGGAAVSRRPPAHCVLSPLFWGLSGGVPVLFYSPGASEWRPPHHGLHPQPLPPAVSCSPRPSEWCPLRERDDVYHVRRGDRRGQEEDLSFRGAPGKHSPSTVLGSYAAPVQPCPRCPPGPTLSAGKARPPP